MIDRTNQGPIATIQHDVWILPGSFAPAAAGAPTALQGASWFSVVRTSEGVYTVTVTDPWFIAAAVLVSVQRTDNPAAGANNAVIANFGNIDVVTARTIVIRLLDAAFAVRDMAANANNRVHFALALRNSSEAS